MDDTLEALLEKATNPKNRYEDWEFIMAFCDKVNEEMEGPQTALKIIVPKIQHKNEKIALLSLALLEACVKNCGQRFHQELGKFRFLNELIRMLSPKYMGNEIPEPVKDKIKKLLYSWKVGLPNETKIADAFEMLKKQGLIFDESEGPDHTLQPLSSDAKVKVTLKEDPRQSEMLGKLLKSSNPEDLRAANRLIREMVRRDEKRMEKLQKRLDELELINNNVKLLNEMLSHYKPGAAQHEKQIIDELYGSVEKMRPQLFRMASELQQNEDGMTQILAANDNLIRVLDYYQKVMGKKEEEDKKEEESAPPPSTTNGGGGTHDLLLELADLNFDNQLAPPISATPTTTSTNNDMLLDDINLGLPGIPAVNTIIPPLDVSLMGDQSSVPLMGGGPSLVSQPPLIGGFQQPLMGGAQLTMGGAQLTMGGAQLTMGGAQPTMGGAQPMMGGIQPMMGGARPTTGGIQSTMGVAQGGTQPLLGGVQPAMSGSSSNSGSDLLSDLNLFGITPTSFPVTTPPSVQPLPPPTNQSPSLSHIPLSPLDNIIIPLESIKPDNRPPVPVINKGGVTVSLLMTQNVPAPDVCVMIISSISTNPFIITNYLVQAAAPKAMKVKLQTPTASEFKAYSPFVPPANVSQIMLLANPSKVPVRLRFRISYMPQNGTEVVEIAEVSFPSS